MAKRLHARHHLRLLRREGDAEGLGPLDVLAHHRHDLREGDQRLDARVPGQRLQCLGQGVTL